MEYIQCILHTNPYTLHLLQLSPVAYLSLSLMVSQAEEKFWLKIFNFAFGSVLVFFKMSFLTLFCVFSSKNFVVFNSYIHIYNSSGIDFCMFVLYQDGGPILFTFCINTNFSSIIYYFFKKPALSPFIYLLPALS